MIGPVAAREGRSLADSTCFDLHRAPTRRECISARSPPFAQLQPERLGDCRFRDVANEAAVERESQLCVGKAFDKLSMRADERRDAFRKLNGRRMVHAWYVPDGAPFASLRWPDMIQSRPFDFRMRSLSDFPYASSSG